MRIVTLGANGPTGRLVVQAALARGWDVTAAVRNPAGYAERHASLEVRLVDVLRPDSLVGLTDDVDAVVSALGIGSSRAPTTMYSEGITNVLAAMMLSSCRRIIAVSAVPAGPWETASWMQRRAVLPMLQRVFGETYDDMRIMERFLLESRFDWTTLRPPRLTNKRGNGAYRTSMAGPVAGSGSISRTDLADALIDVIDKPETFRHALWVAS